MNFDGFKERFNYVKDNWLKGRKEKKVKKSDEDTEFKKNEIISKTEDSQLSNKMEEVMAKKDLINAQNMLRKR